MILNRCAVQLALAVALGIALVVVIPAHTVARVAEGNTVIYTLKGAIGHTLPGDRAIFALELSRAFAFAYFGITHAMATAVVWARRNRAVCTTIVICTVAGSVATYTMSTAGVRADPVFTPFANPALLAKTLAGFTITETV